MKKTGILLVNVGTPDSPETRDVRRYLTEFLNDKYVIDIPWFVRKLLVNGIIVPFRAKKSSELYKKIWTAKGSPIAVYSEELENRLYKRFNGVAEVKLAMRYQNPSIRSVLDGWRSNYIERIVLLPLFPQFASSTSLTAIEKVKHELKRWSRPPQLTVINDFFDHPDFINAFVQNTIDCSPDKYDHVLYSFHGLPNRHIRKIHPGIEVKECECDKEFKSEHRNCYRNACYQTARLIHQGLGRVPEYSVAFQSRLNKDWMTPFTDETVKELAKQGIRRLLVVCPAFVTDCLETIHEIEEEVQEEFKLAGGEYLHLVPSLNATDHWINAISSIVQEVL